MCKLRDGDRLRLSISSDTILCHACARPGALIPYPPYGRWLLVRIPVLAALAILAILVVSGDDRPVFDDADDSGDPAISWRAVGLAFSIGAVASVAFVEALALVRHLDRVFA